MKISIITVVYNNSEFIEDCINSVLSQSYDDIEYIIIDGASTDGTLEIVKQYAAGIAKIVSEPDRGIYDAMNKGLSLATGEVIGILNSDDFYPHLHVLKRVADMFEANRIDSCYGDLVYVEPHNKAKVARFWRSGPYDKRRFYNGWMPPHPTFFVHRSIYERYGRFDPAFGTSADYELMLRFLLKYEISSAYIPEVLVKMRGGGVSNASVKNRILANRMDRLAWRANGLRPYPWTLFLKPILKIRQFIHR
jgi:glycosyltransferase involved in cell wall biosynthesis